MSLVPPTTPAVDVPVYASRRPSALNEALAASGSADLGTPPTNVDAFVRRSNIRTSSAYDVEYGFPSNAIRRPTPSMMGCRLDPHALTEQNGPFVGRPGMDEGTRSMTPVARSYVNTAQDAEN